MKRKPLSRSSRSALCSSFVVGALLFGSSASAEVKLLDPGDEDGWEIATDGRVNAFFSWALGDNMPVAPLDDNNAPLYQFKLAGGTGFETHGTAVPILDDMGERIGNRQGEVNNQRVRSGFVPNILGITARRSLNADTNVAGRISIWSVVESEGHRKYFPNFADVREGYLKIEGPWGSFLGGKALTLFNRGATEADAMYLHGYGLGYPGSINIVGPAAGLIGFGVMGSTFSGGLVYATPVISGLQLSAGVYDPAQLTGSALERTGPIRPEGELTYDVELPDLGRAHVYVNGVYQKLYRNNQPNDESGTARGYGAGARVELGPVHLAGGLHRGVGLGLFFALQPSDSTYNDESELRHNEGYYAIGQFVLGDFDINAGFGRQKVKPLDSDMDPAPSSALGYPQFSLINTQTAYAGAVVYHLRDWLHLDVDVLHADFKWTLGDRQRITFYNAGVTVTW